MPQTHGPPHAGTLNNYGNKAYMFGRLFDKLTFTFFTIAYYWHIGRNTSATNVPNIAGFAFMWCAALLGCCSMLPECCNALLVSSLTARPADCDDGMAQPNVVAWQLPAWPQSLAMVRRRVILPAYGAGPYLPTIVMDRPIYIREMSDGLYTPLTYLTYKVPACPSAAVVMHMRLCCTHALSAKRPAQRRRVQSSEASTVSSPALLYADGRGVRHGHADDHLLLATSLLSRGTRGLLCGHLPHQPHLPVRRHRCGTGVSWGMQASTRLPLALA